MTKYIEAFGVRQSLSDWSRDERCKVSYSTLAARFARGETDTESAISSPPNQAHEESVLYQARLASGLTQEQVGDRLGRSCRYIAAIERGRTPWHNWDRHRLETLAQALGCEPDIVIREAIRLRVKDLVGPQTLEHMLVHVDIETTGGAQCA